MDTSQLPHAKPRPAKRAHPDAALDRRESAKVRVRSEGRCEVMEVEFPASGEVYMRFIPCHKRAVHVMHLIGGIGTRGIGLSALAAHKLHGCVEHHDGIDGKLGGKKFRRIGGLVPHFTDVYERVK